MQKLSVIALVAFLCCCLQGADTVRMGFSVKNITPSSEDLSKGVLTRGWDPPALVATKVNYPLFVKAVAIKDENNRMVVIITADILKFHPVDSLGLQEWFARKYNTSKWHLVLSPSHTHEAPSWYPLKKWGKACDKYEHKEHLEEYVRKYRKVLLNACKETISEAVANADTQTVMKYASLKLGNGRNYNKIAKKRGKIFQTTFPYVEEDLGVIAFFDAKTNKLMALLWSLSTHPTNAFFPCEVKDGKKVKIYHISANIIGSTEQALKDTFGNIETFFAIGAAGEMKVCYPTLKKQWNHKISRFDYFDKGTGKEITTNEEFRHHMYLYGLHIATEIKKALDNNKFSKLKNINIRVAGKTDAVIASKKVNTTAKVKRYLAERQAAEKALKEDKNLTECQRYKYREFLFNYNERGERITPVAFCRISFTENFQIVAMSHEVCSQIGKQIKDYYRNQGIKTLFLGYNLWTSYYPDNVIANFRCPDGKGLYWARISRKEGFDFDKFALDNFKALNFK